MAVTQIIGPRQVPLWADPVEWTSTRAYEPYTFVTYQGDSYCTRQNTPIGVDITNDSYWVKVSDFNAQATAMQNSVLAQIEQNEKDMESLLTNGKNDITTAINTATANMNTQVAAVESVKNEFQTQVDQVSTNTGNISTLVAAVESVKNEFQTQQNEFQTQLDQVSTNVSTNTGNISTLMDNRMLVIGDSYSDYELCGNQTNDSSLWWYMVAQQLQLTPMKYVKGGAGFVRPSSGITFNTLLTNALNALGSNRTCVKWIFVMGGLNDIAQTVNEGAPETQAEFNSAVVNFVIRVRDELPNAHFVLIGPNTFIQNQQNETSKLNQYNAAVYMKTAAFATPCTYVDISKELLNHSSQFISTTGHPNLYGETRLAGAVLNGVFGTQQSYENDISRFPLTFVPNNTVVANSILTVQDSYFTERGIRYKIMLEITRTESEQTTSNAYLGYILIPNGMRYKPNNAQILCTGYRQSSTNKSNNAYMNMTGHTNDIPIYDMNTSGGTNKATIWFDFEVPLNA